jgi:hypothetical protein
MAKQTINIGAAPNDGTGTPLRTSFDYCNQNFTELYTATGPSGNNIVVPGSATITGDLTVDTSTLKVDSTNDRVGIGTATPAAKLIVRDGSNRNFLVASDASQLGYTGIAIGSFTDGAAGYAPLSLIASAMQFGISGSTAMTLNSTGLGVGVTPANGKFIVGADVTTDGNGSWNSTFRNTVGAATTAPKTGISFSGYWNGTSNFANFSGITGGKENSTDANTAGLLTFWTSPNGGSPTTRMTIDSTGNVGISVTPSASTIKTIQSQYGVLVGSDELNISSNAYFGSSWKYISAATAARYSQAAGVHYWFTAAAGVAANDPVTSFTAATAKMTLDLSGNLLVGTTTAGAKITALAGASGQAAIFQQPAQNFWCVLAHNQATSGDNSFVLFGTEASFTSRGSITYNRAGGLVAYNVTSDYRAKDIIGPVSNSGSLIDSLKVYVGKMHGATIERPMLVAHEAQEVAPYAVTGTKDEVDANGKDKYQQIDVSSFVPLLIAEIQSLRARVQTLEAR